jgi:hypothetical protein
MLLLTTSCKQEEEANAEMRVAVSASADAAEAAAATGGEVKIWKGAALLWHEYLPGGSQPTNTYDQLNRLCLQYWGNAAAERKFPIALWQMNRLFEQSPTGEIALRVTNIAAPDQVDAAWVAFNSRSTARLSAPKGQAVHYFVFTKNYFTGPISLASGTAVEGMSLTENPNDHIIWTRIGKDINNQYNAFLNVAECTPLKADGRVRGDGVTTGVGLPPR